jgi:hypothetical protein
MADYTITHSAELMRNFLQDDILGPDAKFQALQTTSGASLLFSIGTDDVLYLTREVSGTKTGWARTDISSALIASRFGEGSGARCANFGTAQCSFGATATIHLAMVVSAADKEDHLFLSLNNSDADTSWADTPTWTAYPFDDPDHKPPQVRVVNVFLSEATGKEYIVVDVLRDPSSGQNLVYRYYIDPAKPGGYSWHPHDLAIDLSAAGYTSCLGRKAGQTLDGLYTAGHVGGHPQLIYQPLYNPYGKTAPPASRFSLPGGMVADTIAACRKADNTSDLYLTSGTGLYYLGSKSQQDGAVATKLADSPMFSGVRDLFAAPAGGGVIVWGLNASNQVFYTTCAGSNPAAGRWSLPLPIVTGAEQVSPYLDRALDANTFFCHIGANRFTKAVKSPETGMWAFRDITLEPPATKAPARDVPSYSTQVHVTDADGQPAANLAVRVQTTNVTGLYINYLHYVVGPTTPVQVTTDSDGSLTIVEPVSSLAGSRLTVTAGDTSLIINPMENAFRKAAGLTTPDALTAAVIRSPDGSTRPFVPSGSSGADLQAVADANQALSRAYDTQQGGAPTARAQVRTARAQVSATGLGGLIVDAGDLIVTAWDEAVDACNVVLDEARGVWNLVLTIGGQVLRAELDRLEHIVASIGEFLSKIVKYIEDVIKFLEFLFEWRDITRTKEVLKTMIKVFLNYQAGRIATVGAELDQQIRGAQAQIASWAGHPDWSGLDAGTPAAMSASAPSQSAPGSMLSYHYQHNAQNTTQLSPQPPVTGQTPGHGVADVLAREGDTLYDAVERLIDLGGRMTTMPLPQILTELMAILGEAVLESARNILDAMFDVASDVAHAAVEMLDTPIHIPVVSDVLNFFGVPDFSFLDVICWLSAIPATLLYKIFAGAAPFPDTPHTAALIAARDYPSLLALYGVAAPVAAVPAAPRVAAARVAAPETAALETAAAAPLAQAADPSSRDIAAHISGHSLSGICSIAAGPIMMMEIIEPGARLLTIPMSYWSAALAVISGGGQGMAAYVANKVVPYEPIKDEYMAGFNDLLVCARCGWKLAGAVNSLDARPLNAPIRVGPLSFPDRRAYWAFGDLVLAVIGLIPVFFHFSELAKADDTPARAIAMVDEFGTVTSILSRIGYGCAVNTTADTEGQVVLVILSGVMSLAAGALQVAEAGLVISHEFGSSSS